MKEVDMLAAKMDLLLKKFDECATNANTSTINALDLQMTCEVCGNVGHSGNDCPETREDAAYINNGFHQQGGNKNGWSNQPRPPFQGNLSFNSNYNLNQPSLGDLVLGQAKINENLTKKISNNDKILKNINTKLEGLSATVQTQLRFNKHLEKQIAQLAAAIPVPDSEKTPGKPEVQFESVNLVSIVKAKCRS
jgi:hypothetical protein